MTFVLKPHVQAALERKFQKEMRDQVEFVINHMTPKERDDWETYLDHLGTTSEQVEEQWDKWVEVASKRERIKNTMAHLKTVLIVVMCAALIYAMCHT